MTGKWNHIKVVPAATYNGVLIGRSVTVDMVYDKALQKFTDRISNYMIFQSLFSTQQRVVICNVFLNSIFSFLNRFLLMSPAHIKIIKRISSKRRVKAHRYTYDHLASPVAHAGIAQPLKDLRKSNIAAVLRNAKDTLEPSQAASDSMLMTDHLSRAAWSYKVMTRTDPPTATTQA